MVTGQEKEVSISVKLKTKRLIDQLRNYLIMKVIINCSPKTIQGNSESNAPLQNCTTFIISIFHFIIWKTSLTYKILSLPDL